MRMAHHKTTMAICCQSVKRCFLISGLHAKCQAVARKELSDKKCQLKAESRWYFPGSKTIMVSCKETLNCNRYMYIASSATLLYVSPTSYIAYKPIYSRDKQWIGQMSNSTHKQWNIAEIININWNGYISCTLPNFTNILVYVFLPL